MSPKLSVSPTVQNVSDTKFVIESYPYHIQPLLERYFMTTDFLSFVL